MLRVGFPTAARPLTMLSRSRPQRVSQSLAHGRCSLNTLGIELVFHRYLLDEKVMSLPSPRAPVVGWGADVL